MAVMLSSSGPLRSFDGYLHGATCTAVEVSAAVMHFQHTYIVVHSGRLLVLRPERTLRRLH